MKSFLNVGGNWSSLNWNKNFITLKIPNFLKGSMFKAQKPSGLTWLILGNPINRQIAFFCNDESEKRSNLCNKYWDEFCQLLLLSKYSFKIYKHNFKKSNQRFKSIVTFLNHLSLENLLIIRRSLYLWILCFYNNIIIII